MPSRIDRLVSLEKKAAPPVQSALMVIVDGPEPSAAQKAEIDAAEAAGRLVLVVTIVDASRPDPAIEKAGTEQ